MKCIRIEPFLFYSNTHICISLDVFVGHFKMRRICVNIFNATLFVFNNKHKISSVCTGSEKITECKFML